MRRRVSPTPDTHGFPRLEVAWVWPWRIGQSFAVSESISRLGPAPSIQTSLAIGRPSGVERRSLGPRRRAWNLRVRAQQASSGCSSDRVYWARAPASGEVVQPGARCPDRRRVAALDGAPVALGGGPGTRIRVRFGLEPDGSFGGIGQILDAAAIRRAARSGHHRHPPPRAPPPPAGRMSAPDSVGARTAARVGVRVTAMTSAHAAPVLAIYRHALATGIAALDDTVPTWAQFDARHLPRLRYIARDERRTVLGWVAAGPAFAAAADAAVIEHAIYVHPHVHRRGHRAPPARHLRRCRRRGGGAPHPDRDLRREHRQPRPAQSCRVHPHRPRTPARPRSAAARAVPDGTHPTPTPPEPADTATWISRHADPQSRSSACHRSSPFPSSRGRAARPAPPIDSSPLRCATMGGAAAWSRQGRFSVVAHPDPSNGQVHPGWGVDDEPRCRRRTVRDIGTAVRAGRGNAQRSDQVPAGVARQNLFAAAFQANAAPP